MPIQHNCAITAVTRLNEYAYEFVLDCGSMSDLIQPGQFLHIKCGHSRVLRRPISICQWQESKVSIVFEVRGEGTEWLSRRTVGDSLDVLGPLGHGFQVQGKCLLVGGGIGIPPLLGCCTLDSTAVLGVRSVDRAMPALVNRFQACGASVHVTSDDGSVGIQGFVDGQITHLLEAGETFDCILACGPKPMLAAVVRVAREFKIPCQVSLEERMGCGVGACLVCACQTGDGRMKHVCKDGPVFDAEEVDLNA